MHFYDRSDVIGKEIERFRFFEYFQLYFCSRLLSKIMPINKKSIFVDIGSNIGNHALYFSKNFNELYLFEPNPITRGILTGNIWASSDSRDKTKIYEYALSDRNGTSSFYSRKPSENKELTNLGNSGLEEDFIGSESDKITVSTIRGDEILQTIIRCPDDFLFIKIDAEGHEVKVFDGLSNSIAKYQPIFWVEIGGEMIFYNINERLTSLGYRAFGIEACGPTNRILRAILGFPYRLIKISKMTPKIYADVFFVPPKYIQLISS